MGTGSRDDDRKTCGKEEQDKSCPGQSCMGHKAPKTQSHSNSPKSVTSFPRSAVVKTSRVADSSERRLPFASSTTALRPLPDSVTFLDRAICSINKGCEEFHCGRYESAMKLYNEASCLWRIHGETSQDHDDDAQDDVLPSQMIQDPKGSFKDSYIYQRAEFDEGMRTFTEPIKMERKAVKNIKSVICYNQGQVHLHLQNWETAKNCFFAAIKGNGNGPTALSFVQVAALQCIGQIQYYLGQYDDAIISYKNSMSYAKQLYGKTHMTVSAALNSLSVIYYHKISSLSSSSNKEDKESATDSVCFDHFLQKAKDCAKRSLSIRLKLLEPNHPDIATSYNNIGRLYVMQEDFQKAIECYEKALSIRAERLGKDSLDYAATAFNTGQSYHHIRNLPKAMQYYQEFLSIAVGKFTRNHRDVAVVLSGMAEIHQELGEMDQALKLYEESLEAGRNSLGDYHPEIAMILNRLGNFHFSTQNYDAAFLAYTQGLDIERRNADDANSLVSLCNLGEIHRQRKEWDSAIRVFKDVLKMQRKHTGNQNQDSAKIANTLHVIGVTYDQKGDSNSGLRYLQEALVMKRIVLGEGHIDLTPTLTCIGIIFFRENRLSLASDLLEEALRIRRTKLGDNHRDVAFTLYNIALVQIKADSLTEAISCLTEVLRIEKNVLGDNHKDVAITLFKLGETFQKYNELGKALHFFQEALCIERTVMLKNDPLTVARTLQEIGNTHLFLGNKEQMMEAFIEAGRMYQQSSTLNPDSIIVAKHMYAIDLSCPKSAAAA